MGTEAISAGKLLELGSLYRRSKVLLSAVELGVFTELSQEPLDAKRLAGKLSLNGRGMHDYFDALVALGLLTRDEAGLYRNSDVCDLYLDKRKPTYLGAAFVQYDRREYEMWGSFTEALRTGLPRTEAIGGDHFTSVYGDASRLAAFARAMTAGSLVPARIIANNFPWQKYRSLCDVGTAQGCFPVQVALANLQIEGIGFDLPELAGSFEDYVAESGLSSRLRFMAGDFFQDQFPEADVIVLGRVLHNWDIDTKRMLLAKASESVRAGGAVIVYDMLIDDARRSSVSGLLSSLNMLVWTSAGFGYTGADCARWMCEAGLQDVRVEPLEGGNSMVVGFK